MSEQKLTPAQEVIAKEYREKYLKMALDTSPPDVAVAEKALRDQYRLLNEKRVSEGLSIPPLDENSEIVWVDSPIQGAVMAAKTANPTVTDFNSPEFKEMVRQQASQASFGSFEAYWISFYDFVSTELKKDSNEMVKVLRDICSHCGVYWTFEKKIIVSRKPVEIHVKNDQLHNEEDYAIKFADGSGIICVNGNYKKSFIESVLDEAYADAK